MSEFQRNIEHAGAWEKPFSVGECSKTIQAMKQRPDFWEFQKLMRSAFDTQCAR